MTTNIQPKTSTSTWIKWAITLIVPMLIMLAPITDVFTVAVRNYCIITTMIIFMFGFELMPMAFPCLMLTVLYVAFGVAPANVALNTYSNNLTIYMLVAALAFAYVLDETGLLNRIALFVLSKCAFSFTGVMMGLYISGVIINAMTFSTGWFVVAAFGLGVTKAMGYTTRCKESALLMILTCMAAFSSPFLLDPKKLMLWQPAFQLIGPDYSPSWTLFLTLGWPYFIFCIVFIWIFGKVTKANQFSIAGGREYFIEEQAKLGKMTSAEVKAAIGVVVLMALLLANPILGLDSNKIFIVITFCFYLPGINIGNMNALKRVDLSTILFLAACMSIGAVGTYVDITSWILSIALPLLDKINPITFSLLIILIGTVANIFMTPAAFSGALAVPVISICAAAAMDPQLGIINLSFATDQYFFPHELAVTAVIFSWGLISMKDFARYMALKVAVFFILFIPLFIPYWKLIGLF